MLIIAVFHKKFNLSEFFLKEVSGAGEARNDRRFFCLIYWVSDAAARANWLHSLVHKAATSKSVTGFFRYSDGLSRYWHLKLV